MPESSMLPPKHGGGGAFIGAALLMLLAMGGLLLFGNSVRRTNRRPRPHPPRARRPQRSSTSHRHPPAARRTGGRGQTHRDGVDDQETSRERSGGLWRHLQGGRVVVPVWRAAGGGRTSPRLLRARTASERDAAGAPRCRRPHRAERRRLWRLDRQRQPGRPEHLQLRVAEFLSGTFPKPNGGCADIQVPIQFKPKTK